MTPEERAQGIGASEAGDLMNEPPWGCRRRLWYQKRGIAPDVEDPARERLYRRGHRLEILVVQEYKFATKRQVFFERKGQQKRVHAEVPYLYHHRDALITKHVYGRTQGILECKTMGAFPFRKMKRNGLLVPYILQLQFALMVSDLAWGAFAILWPDGWELLHWDVHRDDELCNKLRSEGEAFWAQVENGPSPPQLGHDDVRCQRCLWRYGCWNVTVQDDQPWAPVPETVETDLEIDESLVPVLQDLRDAEMIAQDHAEIVDAIKQDIRQKIGEREALRCSGFVVYYRGGKPRTQVVIEKLRKDFPKILEMCSVTKEGSRSLRIYDDRRI